MRKPKNSFQRFLKTSLENRLVLTSVQIKLLQPNITEEQIEEAIDKAKWRILEQRIQNEVTIYTLIDPCFICTCGKPPVHYHMEQTSMACCGDENCCPEADDTDIEVQIAEKLVSIRQMLEQHK